eukprot:3463183-Pyramimonas_sp.AAC.1
MTASNDVSPRSGVSASPTTPGRTTASAASTTPWASASWDVSEVIGARRLPPGRLTRLAEQRPGVEPRASCTSRGAVASASSAHVSWDEN